MARTFVIIAFVCLAALEYRAESRKAWRPVKADSDEFVPGVEAAPVGSDAISNDIAVEETTAEPTTELPTTLAQPKHKARKHGGKHRTRSTSTTEPPTTTTTTTTTTTVPTTIAFARDASSEGSDEDQEEYDDDEAAGKPLTKAGVAASTKTAAPQSVPASAVSKGTAPGQASTKSGQTPFTGKVAVGSSKKPAIGDNEDEENGEEDGGDKLAKTTKQVPAASAATVAGSVKSSPSIAPAAKTVQTTRKAVVTEAQESGEDDGTIVRISIVFNGTEAEGKPGPGKQPGGIASQKPTTVKPAEGNTVGPAKKPSDSPGALAAPNIDENKATKEGEENGGEEEEDEYPDESVSPKPKNATGKPTGSTAAIKTANATSAAPKAAGNATASAGSAKNATTKGLAPANATVTASTVRMANATAISNQTHPIVGRHKFKKAKRGKKGDTRKRKAKKHSKKAKAKAAAEKAAIQKSSQSITGIDSNALFEGRNIVLANSANVSAPSLVPNITSGAGLIVGVITPLPLLSTTKTSLDKLYTGKHKQKISERLKSHNASNDYVAALNGSATTAKVLRDAGTTPWTSANAAVTGKPEHPKKSGKQKHKEGKGNKHKKVPQKTGGGNQAANSTIEFAGAANGTAANVSTAAWNNQTLFGKHQKSKNATKHHDGKGKKKWKKITTTVLPTTTTDSKQNKSQVKTGTDEDAQQQRKPDDATSSLIRKINIERNPQQEKVAQQKAAGQKQLETIVKVVTVASSSKPKKHKKTTAVAVAASTTVAELTTSAVTSTKSHLKAKKRHGKGKTTTPPAESEELHTTQNYSELHKLFSTDKNYKFIGGEGDNPAFIQAGPSVESEAN